MTAIPTPKHCTARAHTHTPHTPRSRTLARHLNSRSLFLHPENGQVGRWAVPSSLWAGPAGCWRRGGARFLLFQPGMVREKVRGGAHLAGTRPATLACLILQRKRARVQALSLGDRGPEALPPFPTASSPPAPANVFFTATFYFWQRVIHVVLYWLRWKKVPPFKQI